MAFREMFDLLPLPAAVLRRRDGVVLAANAGYAELLACERSDLIGHSLHELGLGLEEAERVTLLERIDRDGRVRGLEARLRTRSGIHRHVLKHAEAIDFLDEPCILNLNVDITDRRRAEEEMRRHEERLASIIDTAMDAIITVDSRHHVVVFNHAAETLFGVTAVEAIGHPLDRFVPGESRAEHAGHMARFAASGLNTRAMGRVRELSGLRANGEAFPIEASISRAGEGERLSMTVMARDVTTLRRAEQAHLERASAEAANRAKTDLLSRVSHELRTPLNAILGFTQLLQADIGGPFAERQREHLALVRQAGLQLRGLIDEILDLSGIEAGRISVEVRRIELCEVLDGVLRLSQPHAQDCQVSLHDDFAGQCPIWLQADPDRLRQVMLNLISNAIKYNRPGGEVRVSVAHRASSVTIDVRDNGIGMTARQVDGLFQPFNRLGREASGVQGVGIGLVLVRQLLSLMGGSLSLESLPDVGSVARVTLPACPGEAHATFAAADEESRQHIDPRGLVLYVEDNEVNAVLVEQLLRPWPGVRLIVAPDGRSGLAMVHSERPDLVLLDLQLPDMSGVEVLHALKANPDTRSLPVVVLSANVMVDEIEALREAGAADYWAKPLQFDQFKDGIRRLLRAAGHDSDGF